MKKTTSVILLGIISLVAITYAYILTVWNVNAPLSLGTVRLNIETYLAGKNQLTHPSVYDFQSEWNGYRYWMAYSPYPNANGEEENPCIAVSNDLLYWETPYGLANPIADNEETSCNELKDPHIVYRDDLDRLEMWYLGRVSENLGGDNTSLLLMRKHSVDGIHWSTYEIMASTQYLSPTIIWVDGKYQMWAIGYDLWNTAGDFTYQESFDGVTWSDPQRCSIDGIEDGHDLWHGSVSLTDRGYEFVYIDNTDKQEIYRTISSDGITFNKPEVIIENGGYWDYLYRPMLLKNDDGYYCFYGVVSKANEWYVSMSFSQANGEFCGINENDSTSMVSITTPVTNTHGLKYIISEIYHNFRNSIRFELILLLLLEIPTVCVIKNVKNDFKNDFIIIFNLLITSIYVFMRFSPNSFGIILADCWGLIFINLFIDTILLFTANVITKEKRT